MEPRDEYEGNLFTLCFIVFPTTGVLVAVSCISIPAEYWKEVAVAGHVIVLGTAIVHFAPLLVLILFPYRFIQVTIHPIS